MNAQQVRDALLAYYKAYSSTFAQVELESAEELADALTHHLALVAELVDALMTAVRQNSHDMLMTGEELRQCEAALSNIGGAA